jgi:hypothetical protein
MLKPSPTYDSVRFILMKISTEWVKNYYILCQFSIPNHVVGTVAVGAGAALRYGSGSDQKMRLLAAPAPAPQHWLQIIKLKALIIPMN